MSDGLNRVFLIGNLGAEPELRMSPSGTAVLKLRLATSETYFDRNKEKQERTEWHSVTVFGKRAEGLGKFLTKGARIFVEGGLRTSSYEDREGNKRYRTEVVASNVILAGGARGGERTQDSAPQTSGGNYSEEDYGGSGSDDDIPF